MTILEILADEERKQKKEWLEKSRGLPAELVNPTLCHIEAEAAKSSMEWCRIVRKLAQETIPGLPGWAVGCPECWQG